MFYHQHNVTLDSVHFPISREYQSSPPVAFLEKGCLKICKKSTGEQPWRNVIPIKLQSNFTEITLRYGYSPINLLHILGTSYPKNTTGELVLRIATNVLKAFHK